MRRRKRLVALVSLIVIASAVMIYAVEPVWWCPIDCHPYQAWYCYEFMEIFCYVWCLRDKPGGGQFVAEGWCGDPQ